MRIKLYLIPKFLVSKMATHLRPEGMEVIEQDHPCDKGKLECFLNEQEIMATFVLLSWKVLQWNLNFQLWRYFLLSPDLVEGKNIPACPIPMWTWPSMTQWRPMIIRYAPKDRCCHATTNKPTTKMPMFFGTQHFSLPLNFCVHFSPTLVLLCSANYLRFLSDLVNINRQWCYEVTNPNIIITFYDRKITLAAT